MLSLVTFCGVFLGLERSAAAGVRRARALTGALHFGVLLGEIKVNTQNHMSSPGMVLGRSREDLGRLVNLPGDASAGSGALLTPPHRLRASTYVGQFEA